MSREGIMKYWPAAAAIVMIAGGWGQLTWRVAAAEKETDSIKTEVRSAATKTGDDHDTLIELRTEQKQMKEQLDKTDKKIDRILEKLNR